MQVLAIIKDRVPGVASETVCGGHSRQRHVMLSQSHDVEVRMVLQSRRDEPARYILIKYEGLRPISIHRGDHFVYNAIEPKFHGSGFLVPSSYQMLQGCR